VTFTGFGLLKVLIRCCTDNAISGYERRFIRTSQIALKIWLGVADHQVAKLQILDSFITGTQYSAAGGCLLNPQCIVRDCLAYVLFNGSIKKSHREQIATLSCEFYPIARLVTVIC